LGGGSSLVAPTIQSEISAFPSTDGTAAYWSVGSGKGQTAFLNNDPTQFTSVTVSAGTTVTLTASGTVDFANSDAPLSASQISAYTSTGGLGVTDGPLIQLPYIVTPITIPLVNGPTGTGPTLPNGGTTATVALNDADLCGIFSGAFTNWNQITNPDNGSLYPAGAIKVVYRSDNSGTTDLLTAHLQAVCPVPSGTTAVPVTFTATQNFASLFPSSTPPSNFVPASGSGGVAASLLALSGAGVGYLSPDYTNTFLAPASSPAQTNNLSVASVRNTTTNTDVVPSYQNATLAIGTVTAPTGSNASNPSLWVPNASNPTTGYPISGTSQIITSQCYATHSDTPTVAASVVDFLTLHYSSNASIINGNGFDVVPAAYVTAIKADFLSNTSGLKLNIGTASVCGPLAGL
jgi:ABC-type phosphate transport system substrate-binding protein